MEWHKNKIHAIVEKQKGIPFNGTGHSGMGVYHGVWVFREFTHLSTVLFGHNHSKDKFLRTFIK